MRFLFFLEHCVDPYISEKPPFWGPILTGLVFVVENRFNMGMLQCKLPLIVIHYATFMEIKVV